MPYQGLPDGLYLVKQKSPAKGVDHYGILDIGNRIQHPDVDGINPIVIHQVPPAMKIDWFQNTGSWEILGQITDEGMARQRLNETAAMPNYNLFGNNCEHFARFIATGKRESTQLQAAGIVVGLAALAFVVLAD